MPAAISKSGANSASIQRFGRDGGAAVQRVAGATFGCGVADLRAGKDVAVDPGRGILLSQSGDRTCNHEVRQQQLADGGVSDQFAEDCELVAHANMVFLTPADDVLTGWRRGLSISGRSGPPT